MIQRSRRSIPACNSYECKTDSYTEGWDVPTSEGANDPMYRYKAPAAAASLSTVRSIPACTSYECKKKTIPWEYEIPDVNEDGDYYKYKTASMAQGLWYTPDEDNDGDYWTSNMPEKYQSDPYPSNGPMKWAN